MWRRLVMTRWFVDMDWYTWSGTHARTDDHPFVRDYWGWHLHWHKNGLLRGLISRLKLVSVSLTPTLSAVFEAQLDRRPCCCPTCPPFTPFIHQHRNIVGQWFELLRSSKRMSAEGWNMFLTLCFSFFHGTDKSLPIVTIMATMISIHFSKWRWSIRVDMLSLYPSTNRLLLMKFTFRYLNAHIRPLFVLPVALRMYPRWCFE